MSCGRKPRCGFRKINYMIVGAIHESPVTNAELMFKTVNGFRKINYMIVGRGLAPAERFVRI